MNLAELLLLLLSCCGLTFIVVHAEILDLLKIRQLFNKSPFVKKLTRCSLCTGFWVGSFIGLIWIPFKFFIPFCFASSAISFIFERIVILLDEHILKLEHESNRKHNQ